MEIARLLESAAHFSKNAGVPGLEPTARFLLLYGAAIDLAMTVIRSAGLRTRGAAHHETAFEALAYLLGGEGREASKYFQTCREKRNRISYSNWIEVPETEVDELRRETERIRRVILSKLGRNRPHWDEK